MKFKRVNLPDDAKESSAIDQYLSEKFSKLAGFQVEQGTRESPDREEVSEDTSEEIDDIKIGSSGDLQAKDTPMALFLNFAMGAKDVAFYLAFHSMYTSNLKESILDEDNFFWMLPGAVGVKIGDERAIKLMKDQIIPDSVVKLVDKCIEQIEKNKKEIGQNDITYEEVMVRAKILDKIIEIDSGQSFIKNTIIESGPLTQHANYVEVIDPLDNFSVEIAGEDL